MTSTRSSCPLAGTRAPRPHAIYLPSGTDNDESADSTSSVLGMNDRVQPVPHFDLDKTFPAILATFSLLRKLPESQDSDALRALAPVFSNCLDAILRSVANHLPTSRKYHPALTGVEFSKETFLGHVSRILQHDSPSARKETIQLAMQSLEVTMSSLKGLLNVVAHELKPLPQIPVEQGPAPVADQVDAADSIAHFSAETHTTVEDTLAVDPTETPSQKSTLSTLLDPFRHGLKLRPSRLDLSRVESTGSSTAVNSDSDDLGCGYVHINIHNSLAQFPLSIDRTVGRVPHPEDATELLRGRNGLAQLASLKALVRYMSSADADADVEIVDVFFLCFRFFSSPQETFDALLARYDERLDCRSSSLTRSHSIQVKMRVARLLYHWVDLHWRAEDAEILTPLTQFAVSRLTKDIPQEASSMLISSLRQRACTGEKSKGQRKEKTIARAQAKYRQHMLGSTWEPRERKPMMRGDFSKVKLLHFHSPGGHAMLAFQLTLLLWEKYRAFDPEDAVRHLIDRNGDDSPPTSEVGQRVANFVAYEKAVHRFVMNSIGTAETVQMRTDVTEFFIELADKCHEIRNYSASCMIALACDRQTVLPFVTKLRLSPTHRRIKTKLMEFHTRENHHMAGYKQALQRCCCPALPGMALFIKEVARGCGSGPYDQHPDVPGSRLINLKRYRPITWAVRAMEKCHAPFKIQRVDYVCDWLEHVLSAYLVGTEMEWETRIRENCREL